MQIYFQYLDFGEGKDYTWKKKPNLKLKFHLQRGVLYTTQIYIKT